VITVSIPRESLFHQPARGLAEAMATGQEGERLHLTTSVPHDGPDLDQLASLVLRQSWEQHQREKRLERIAMLKTTVIIVLTMGALATMFWTRVG